MPGKRIVIDTDIASAASNFSVDNVSGKCRDFLNSFRELGYVVVMTQDIREEWSRHRSRYTNAWLTSMTARRKVKFIDITDDEKNLMIQRIKRIVLDEDIQKIVIKDLHIVLAALSSDRIIISNDSRARYHFSNISRNMREIQNVMWIILKENDVIEWLGDGAKTERNQQLGHNI